MFYEVNHGYVGLGAMKVYRTAAQAAADIEQFGKDLGPVATQGGLLTQQTVFKYAAAQGRLQALQQEVESIGGRLNGLNNQLNAVVSELENLGVMKAGDFAKMGAKMVVSAKIPIIGWLSIGAQIGTMVGVDLSFLDVFGSAKKKKQQAEALVKRAQELMIQMMYWKKRADMLQTEGETLAQTIKDTGEKGVAVQLIATPQHLDVKHVITNVKDPSGMITGFTYQKKEKIVDTAESKAYGATVFKTAEELAIRTALQPSGDRLPVGFQTIYSPVLEQGKIVAKVPHINTTLPNPVDRRVVYGGLLSGVGVDEDHTVFNAMAFGGFVIIALLVLRK